MSIKEQAMTVKLAVGFWAGHRFDREASEELVEKNNAAKGAARVNKHLVPKEALAPIVSAAGALRNHFYERSLPWRDSGDRLITRKMFPDFIREHETLANDFRREVEKFLTTTYPAAVEQAEFRMGELFNRDDYPRVGEIRHRFYVELDIDAVTDANDFRVKLDDEHMDMVRKSMTAAAEERLNKAMADVWARVAKVVGHLAERLGDEDAVFRDSTLTNIEELMELIPGLNVTDDPNLERVRQEIQKCLTGLDPKAVRKDTEHRKEIAGEAKRILDAMAGFTAAFDGMALAA